MSDLISRQDAIDALAKVAREKFNLSDEFNHYLAGLMDGEYAIRQLPSVQLERKTGRWIPYEYGDERWHQCTACGVADKYIDYVKGYDGKTGKLVSVRNYCPNCGADMRGE